MYSDGNLCIERVSLALNRKLSIDCYSHDRDGYSDVAGSGPDSTPVKVNVSRLIDVS